jgi:hypothetical protein
MARTKPKRAKLDKFYPPQGKPTQLSFDYQDQHSKDDGL